MEEFIVNAYGDDIEIRKDGDEIEINCNLAFPSWEYNVSSFTLTKDQAISLMEWLSRATA